MFTSDFRPRRSMIPLIVELSFAEDAPGSAPAVAGQGGGGNTPSTIQTPASAADPAQIQKQLVSEAFSSGLNEQRDRTISKLQKAGIDIMKDEDGKPSISLTLSALEERMKAAPKTIEKSNQAPVVVGRPDPILDERLRELQAQLELVTGQKTQAETKAAELDARYQLQLEKIELTAAFSGSELVEGALDDGIDLFLKRFKITRTSEDEIRVKSRHNGMNVLNAEAKPASIKEAVKKFLE